MDVRRLEVFCKVIESKSFTKAARVLGLSQPTVSEHIRILEKKQGVKFVDRLGREALPTQAGLILYRYARRIIALRDESVQAIESFSGSLTGRLVLGASTIPGTYMLPSIVGSFKEQNPSIEITLRIAGSREIAQLVLDSEVEAGFVGARWKDVSLKWWKIFSDELVLVVYPDHPWWGRKTVAPASLKEEPFIIRERHSGTRRTTESLLVKEGLDLSTFRIVAEMGSTEAVRQSVKARIGIAILSRLAVVDDIASGVLHVVGVRGVRFKRPIYLVQRVKREPSPICSAFVEHLRDGGPG